MFPICQTSCPNVFTNSKFMVSCFGFSNFTLVKESNGFGFAISLILLFCTSFNPVEANILSQKVLVPHSFVTVRQTLNTPLGKQWTGFSSDDVNPSPKS